MTTIAEYVAESFEDKPVLLRETPSGLRYLWLERTRLPFITEWVLCDDQERGWPVEDHADVDELVRNWADENGDWPTFGERVYAGAEIGTCEDCEMWLVAGETNPALHKAFCELVNE